ncbi:SIS domain-containing protein, partial [Periconia macrospinosa]
LPMPSSIATMKRKRSSSPSSAAATAAALTPPLSIEEDPSSTCLLTRAVHVLSTAATALSQVTFLYQSDPTAREGLLQAVECIQSVVDTGGKLIVCGVGKSGLVGRKTVASLKSLGVACSFLHPIEALHGDLGDVRENDAILFISYSGKTAELLSLLPHIPRKTPILAITSQTRPLDCALLRPRVTSTSSTSPSIAILLPAPIPEKEETSFGVSAPTTSTTVTIAVGDMLALTLAEALYGGKTRTRDVFARNHPGGAIG